ncbi:cytidine deaminase [Propionibacteriaceae bacterium Y2011]|uniref:cytidine deaminase n=1 Tax=Microlunatus sp. Y2014 TaxID=3418488 RepID=UPI003B45CCBD
MSSQHSGVDPDSVDWERLRDSAREAAGHAYAPYSGFPVGAAALVDDGRIVTGCNVENASYGVGLCAECGLVSQLQATGGGRLVAFACVAGDGEALMPCGRCRQLLHEFGGDTLLVDTPAGVLPMRHVLPYAFGPAELTRTTGDSGGAGGGTVADESPTDEEE